MTDAPERIWTAPHVAGLGIPWDRWYSRRYTPEDVEYIRADLVPRWSSDMDTAPKDGMLQLVEMLREVDASPTQSMIWEVNGRLYQVDVLPAPPKEGE